MANLIITAAQVLASENAKIVNGQFGVAVTPGQTVFYEDESRTWKLASSTSTIAAGRTEGVALMTGSIGARGSIQIDGRLIVGAAAAPVKGTLYIQGATPGSIAPDADAVTGWLKTVIGFGDGSGGIMLILNSSDMILA